MNSGLDTNDAETRVPAELQGFSWAAFLWGGVWAIAYRVWVGLFAFVPFFGLIMHVVLGLRGAEWAYRKGTVTDVARFKSSQRNWVIAWAAVAVLMVPVGIGMASALAIFGVKKYVTNAKRAEATTALAQMTKGMAACGNRGDIPDTSAWIPADLSSVRGMKYMPGPREWPSQAAFACAGFAFTTPQYFRYRWVQVTSASGQFEAEADLNGDGVVDMALQQGVHCTAGNCEVEPLVGDLPAAP